MSETKAHPEVLITPSEKQYRKLVSDLAELREDGAESNTSAVVEAVAEQAARVRRKRVRGAAK